MNQPTLLAHVGIRSPVAALTLLLFTLFGVSYAYFLQNEYSYNVVCRAGLAANLVQHGRVDINDFEHLTEDKAVRDGVYYCDKAPGMSFLAVPAAFVFTRVIPITRDTPTAEGAAWPAFLFLSTVTTSGLWCALAAIVLFGYLLRRTGNVHAALIGAVTFGLATPIWGWATSFFSHAAAGAFLLMGFIALDTAVRRIGVTRPGTWLPIAGGLALGASVAVEYTCAVPAAIIGAVLVLSNLRRETFVPLLRIFAMAFAAAVVAIVPVLIYHDAAFGSPFTTGYGFAAVYLETRSGLFGINPPAPGLIVELLFGPRRGLLWYAPIVLAALYAGYRYARDKDQRPAVIVAGLILVWFVIMNAGFVYWLGGASTGPRYLTPALGFVALVLGLGWTSLGTLWRRIALGLLALSVLINLAAVSVDMTVGEEFANPLFERVFPQFFAGVLHQTMLYKALRIDGLIALAPLLLIWAGLGWLIWREMRRIETTAASKLDAA